MLNLEVDFNIDKLEGNVRKKAQRVLMKAMFKMEELAIKKAPVDQGFLRTNISLNPRMLSNTYVLTSAAPYSEDLEYGNSPRFVKTDVLAAWAERKGITSNPVETAVFAHYVQQKIAREGVNAQPFMRPSLFEVKNKWLKIYTLEEFGKGSV